MPPRYGASALRHFPLWLLALAGCASAHHEIEIQPSGHEAETTFERMLSGFEHCSFDRVYLDPETGAPAHPYLAERDLKPCEIIDEMAYFCVDENFHGLPVSKLMIPASTFDLHAIFIDLPLDEARKISRDHFGSDFHESHNSREGNTPELIENPNDRDKSILSCNQKAA